MRKGCVCLCLALVLCLSAAAADELRIWHFDVGQADCTFLLTPSGVSVLFDCGEESWSSSRNADEIARQIVTITGSRCVNFFVLSHFHLDHVGHIREGGLWGLLETHGFTIQTLVVRDYMAFPGNAGEWISYLSSSAQIENIQTASVTSTPIDLGSGVSLTICSANGEPRLSRLQEPVCAGLDENDLSLGVLLPYLDFQEWIGGDLSGVSENGYTDIETYSAARIGDVEVLRVNHHGSPYSSNHAFLANLDPEVSIISVGEGNRHGHPNPGVVSRLCATSDVYMTSSCTADWGNCECISSLAACGGVYIETDGYGFSVVDAITDEVLGIYEALPIERVDTDDDGYYGDVDLDDSDPEVGVNECTTLASES